MLLKQKEKDAGHCIPYMMKSFALSTEVPVPLVTGQCPKSLSKIQRLHLSNIILLVETYIVKHLKVRNCS